MGEAKSEHQRLLLQVGKTLFHIGVNDERKAGFGDFGIFSGFESFGGGGGGFVVLARILLALARRDVATAHLVEAEGRDEIGCAVDHQDSGYSRSVIEKADEGSGDEHAALHTHENGGVCAGELARGNDFLNERVDRGPVHGGTDAGDERHGVEMPELEMAAPGDVSGGENEEAADEIEQDAEIAAVDAVDEHAAEEGHE